MCKLNATGEWICIYRSVPFERFLGFWLIVVPPILCVGEPLGTRPELLIPGPFLPENLENFQLHTQHTTVCSRTGNPSNLPSHHGTTLSKTAPFFIFLMPKWFFSNMSVVVFGFVPVDTVFLRAPFFIFLMPKWFFSNMSVVVFGFVPVDTVFWGCDLKFCWKVHLWVCKCTKYVVETHKIAWQVCH